MTAMAAEGRGAADGNAQGPMREPSDPSVPPQSKVVGRDK